MPNNKSAMKRLKTSEKQRVRNKARKTVLKTVEKKLRVAVEASEKEKVLELLKESHAKFDRAVKAGVIHRNKAARKKSQLQKLASSCS